MLKSKSEFGDSKTETKTASGLTVYLVEGLSDARLYYGELKRYIDQALKIIDSSKAKDHIVEVAGHLIEGIPSTLMKLDKALSATAYAASHMDHEELAQKLQPEKVNELENALEDVRLQQVRTNSNEVPMTMSPKNASDRLLLLVKEADLAGDPKVITAGLVDLIRSLEGQSKTASIEMNPVDTLRGLAHKLVGSTKHSKVELIAILKGVLADTLTSDKNNLEFSKEAGSLTPSSSDVRKPIYLIKDAQKSLGKLQDWSKEFQADLESCSPIDTKESKLAHRESQVLCGSLGNHTKSALKDLEGIMLHCIHLVKSVDKAYGRHNVEACLTLNVQASSMFTPVALEQMVATMPFEANSREEVKAGFRDANPDMSEEDLEEAANCWEDYKSKEVEAQQNNYSYARPVGTLVSDDCTVGDLSTKVSQ